MTTKLFGDGDTAAIRSRWQAENCNTTGKADPAVEPAPAAADDAAADSAHAGTPAPMAASACELLRAASYTEGLAEAQKGVVAVLKAQGTAAELAGAKAAYTLAAHQLNGVLRHLPQPEQPAALPSLLMNGSIGPLGAIVTGASTGDDTVKHQSDAEFWGRISKTIGDLKDNYLGVYETAMEQNNRFQKEFTAIYARIAEWQGGDDKSTTLELGVRYKEKRPDEDERVKPEDLKGLLDALDDLKWFNRDGESTVFISDKETAGWTNEQEKACDPKNLGEVDKAKRQERSDQNKKIAEKWATDLGLQPGGVLRSVHNYTTWLVKLDFAPVTKMIEGLKDLVAKHPLNDGMIKLTTSQFQAWKQGFDGFADGLKNTSSVMAKKLVNAQSIYENLIKVLSSTIAAMLETNKLFLQN